MSKRSVLMGSLLAALLAFSAVSYAEVSKSHKVTIMVPTVNQIGMMVGGDFTVEFTWVEASWLLVAPDAATDTLWYATNVAGQKITVALDYDLPANLILKLNGTPLTAVGFDLVNPVDLTSGVRTKSLKYTVSGDLRVAPDEYIRTITYTMTSGT